MKLYEDDKICIQLLKRNGKNEIIINYYIAGKWVAELQTTDLYDYNLASLNLSV